MKQVRPIFFIAILFCVLFPVAATPADQPATKIACQSSGGTWDTNKWAPNGYCIQDTEAKCIARNGSWGRVCMSQSLACIRAYSDANKMCSDGADCEGGKCLDAGNKANEEGVIFGRCVASDNPCGSFNLIKQGKYGRQIHVD